MAGPLVINQRKEWATVGPYTSVSLNRNLSLFLKIMILISTWSKKVVELDFRWRKARISSATRGLQWLGQCVATPKGEANRLNPTPVQIEGCNPPS